ncbi:hypothetical protein [Clostridium sp.]|uniref:hypothetical protein n=1 Tax=Clostridium sp. TaxID=1506 RepID=UPI0025BEAAB7|nr:hypothetical protein [Clostridium sp.]
MEVSLCRLGAALEQLVRFATDLYKDVIKTFVIKIKIEDKIDEEHAIQRLY